MAGPITHTVFAEVALKYFLSEKDSQQFIVGNLFPDIRYLKVIDRQSTHSKNLTLNDVRQESDSFKSGMLFHSLVDEVREDIVVQSRAYDMLPDNHLTTIALKICEDIKLHDHTDNWPTYIKYLDDIKPQELAYGISADKVIQWHGINARLFINPSITEYSKFLSAVGLNQEQVDELSRLIDQITTSGVTDAYINDMHTNLQSVLESKN